MVTGSKQAKFATAIILIFLIFAMVFLVWNVKNVWATTPTWKSFNWTHRTNDPDGYDFSKEELNSCTASADMCTNGGGDTDYAKKTYLIAKGANAKLKNTGSSIKDCPIEGGYTSSKFSLTFNQNDYGCLKANDGTYYVIQVTNIGAVGTFWGRSTIKWFEHTFEIICNDGKDGDNDTFIDCNDTDCLDNIICVNCTDNDTDGYNITGPPCGPIDCNDSNVSIWQNLTGYTDSDGDTYGTGAAQIICSGASLPSGYANVGGDCNDSDSKINPGATENCTNKIDDDCDGLKDCDDTDDCSDDPACAKVCVDVDGDGYNVTANGCGTVDCNDSNSAVYPGATEVCNQIDDNCDNVIDNVNGGTSIEETGCGCYNGTAPSAENATNGIDDNCDGQLHANETDADNDGFAIYQGDCNDLDPSINPLAVENCINGIDDNCNGEKDEGCTGGGGGGGHGGRSRSTVTPTSATFVIGNGKCEVGESAENACIDCGCPTGEECVNNACILENPAAAAAARDIEPPITPGITAQIAFRPFSLLGLLLVVLFATMIAGLGSYYYFHYKPKKQYAKFAGLKKA